MDILWEKTLVKLNITADIDGKIMAKIDEEMKGDKPPYYQAASYYFENGTKKKSQRIKKEIRTFRKINQQKI